MYKVLIGEMVKLPGISQPVLRLSPFATIVTTVWVGVHLADDGIKIYKWAKAKYQARRAEKDRAVEDAAREGAKQGSYEAHQHA